MHQQQLMTWPAPSDKRQAVAAALEQPQGMLLGCLGALGSCCKIGLVLQEGRLRPAVCSAQGWTVTGVSLGL